MNNNRNEWNRNDNQNHEHGRGFSQRQSRSGQQRSPSQRDDVRSRDSENQFGGQGMERGQNLRGMQNEQSWDDADEQHWGQGQGQSSDRGMSGEDWSPSDDYGTRQQQYGGGQYDSAASSERQSFGRQDPRFDSRSRGYGQSYESMNGFGQQNRSYNGGQYNGGQYGGGQYGGSQYSGGNLGSGERQFNKGPKGYKRSDERIKEDLSERLHQLYDLDSSDVEVSVSNGEITLTGTVPTREMRFRLEHLADGILGASDVTNNVKVKRETASAGSDSTGSQAGKTSPSSGGSKGQARS